MGDNLGPNGLWSGFITAPADDPQRRPLGKHPSRMAARGIPLLLLRLIEISQIGRSLTLLCRHDQAVGAEKVGLALDPDMIVVLHAVVLDPPRTRVGAAAIVFGHGPGTCQGMVEDGDFVVDDVWLAL